MRKLKLFITTLALLGGVISGNAYGWTDSDGAIVGTGEFYFYNVGSQRFLTQGCWWGTHMASDGAGKVVTISGSADAYNMHMAGVAASSWISGGDYVDTGVASGKEVTTDDNLKWTFTLVEATSHTYTIKNNSTNKYLHSISNIDTNTGHSVESGESVADDTYYWILIPKANRETLTGTSTTYPIDATHLVTNPDGEWYIRNENNEWKEYTHGGWTGTFSHNSSAQDIYYSSFYEIWAGQWQRSNGTLVGNNYHLNDFDEYNKITSLPNGKYRITITAEATQQIDAEEITGAFIYANTAQTAISTRGNYNVECTITDGTIKAGVKTVSTTANWVSFDNLRLTYLDPYISVISTYIPSATATVLTANAWYKFTAVSTGNYSFSTTTISDIVCTSTDQLLSEATGTTATATMALTSGTTYYIKSSSAQTLTITPQSFTYTVGAATPSVADGGYTQSPTFTLTFASANTDDPDGSLSILDASKITVNSTQATASITDNVLTITLTDAIAAATDFAISVAVGAVGYNVENSNEATTLTIHTPAILDGTYYLYDATNKLFLARGKNSGTRAVVDKYGVPFNLTTDGTNASLIEFVDWTGVHLFFDKNDHANCWLYTDGGSGQGNNRLFAFEKTTGGYYLRDAAKAVYIKHDNSVLNVPTTTEGEAAVWQVLTKSERDAILTAYQTVNYQDIITAASLSTTTNEFESYLTTNYAGKDYTDKVGTAKITNVAGDWTWTGVRGQDNQPAYNNAAEAWNATGSWSQTIENLPEGIYRVKINAFERRSNNADSYALGQAGYGTVTSSYLKANDEQVRLKSWYEEVEKNGNSYNPNNMGEAVTAFNNDKYKSEVYTYVGSDGKLTLTIAKPNYIWDCWLLWNNVTLTYFTDEVNTAEVTALLATAAEYLDKPMLATLKQAISEAKTALEDNSNIANYNALQTAIENSQSSVDSYAAMKTNYLDPLATVLANTNVYTTDAYNSVYGNYLTAYTNGTIANADANALRWDAATNGNGTRPVDNLLMPSWTIGGNAPGSSFYQNTWSTEGNNDGSNFKTPFFEYWVNGNSVLEATTLQATQAGLTANAVYKVTAWVRVQESNAGTKSANGITMQVGDGATIDVSDGTNIDNSKRYIGEFKAFGQTDASGNLTIKFVVAENSNISWLAFKNVKYEEVTVANITITEDATSAPAASEYANVTLNRAFNEGWNAVCLPFATPAFDDCEIAEFVGETGSDNVTLNFEKVTSFEANTPYLVYFPSAVAFGKVFEGVAVDPQDVKSEGTAFDFMGTYTVKDIAAGDYVVSGGKLSKASSTISLKPTRTYFTPKTGTTARIAGFTIGGVTTGISDIFPDEANAAEGIYNMQGQKVSGKVQKGVYIVNGKKVIK